MTSLTDYNNKLSVEELSNIYVAIRIFLKRILIHPKLLYEDKQKVIASIMKQINEFFHEFSFSTNASAINVFSIGPCIDCTSFVNDDFLNSIDMLYLLILDGFGLNIINGSKRTDTLCNTFAYKLVLSDKNERAFYFTRSASKEILTLLVHTIQEKNSIVQHYLNFDISHEVDYSEKSANAFFMKIATITYFILRFRFSQSRDGFLSHEN